MCVDRQTVRVVNTANIDLSVTKLTWADDSNNITTLMHTVCRPTSRQPGQLAGAPRL